MRKRGFTLVELIAVIGILAVILVIAIPKVNDYILRRKQDNFLTTARNISRQIEYDNLDFKNFTRVTLGDLNLENLSDSRFDLEKSVAYIEDGEVYIDLVGKGDYFGMHACRVQSSTKELVIQDEAC